VAAAVVFGLFAAFVVTSAQVPSARARGAVVRTAPARTHVVEIRRFRFEPTSLEVAGGDTIRWINRDPVPHTATARDSTWNSGRIEPGSEWQVVVPRNVTPNYFCIYHPTMTGSVQVVGASQARTVR
jgi:plastocyanin